MAFYDSIGNWDLKPKAGMPGSGGGYSDASSAQNSASEAKLFRPDVDEVQQGYNTLQGGIDLNDPQRAAVQTQQSLGATLKQLLGGAEQQGTERINEGFQRSTSEATQRLIDRGLDAGMVNEQGQRSQNRESNFAVGDLMDQLLNRDVQDNNQVSKEVANLLFGSSKQATDLINSLLKSSSIGNISESQAESHSFSQNSI